MKCPECNGDMQAIPVNARPESSEWYCDKCHKSVEMTPEEFASMTGSPLRRRQ